MINSLYLFFISQNYLFFALLCFENAKQNPSLKDLTSVANIFGVFTLELIAISIISAIGLLLLTLWRAYRIYGEGRTTKEVTTLSGHLFLMVMPLFYFLRIPLIYGILSNIGDSMDEESPENRDENCFL